MTELDRPFDITLASSVDSHVDNKASHFVTKLTRPIELHGAWKVAIADITYPLTWNTLFRDCPIWFRVWRLNRKLDDHRTQSTALIGIRSSIVAMRADERRKHEDLTRLNQVLKEARQAYDKLAEDIGIATGELGTETDDTKKLVISARVKDLTDEQNLVAERRHQASEGVQLCQARWDKIGVDLQNLERREQVTLATLLSLRRQLMDERVVNSVTDHDSWGAGPFANFLQDELSKDANNEYQVVRDGLVPKGYYQTPQDIAKRICAEFSTAVVGTSFESAKLSFDYDQVQRRGRFYATTGYEIELITPNTYLLGEVLGFGYRDTIKQVPTAATGSSGLEAHFYPMRITSRNIPKLDVPSIIWIYTDIIREQYVGNEKVQLLNKCPVQGEYGSQAFWSFYNLRFHPVTVSNLSEITIKLVSGTSKEPIPIADGEVVVTLQFERAGYI